MKQKEKNLNSIILTKHLDLEKLIEIKNLYTYYHEKMEMQTIIF